MGEPDDALRAFAVERGLRGLELIGRGLEFTVYRGSDGSGRDVALRLAERRFDANANDPYVDTRALLVQEYEITRYLAARGFPVAEPFELVFSKNDDGLDILLCQYIPDDGSGFDSFQLGQLLANLHAMPPPPIKMVASEGLPTQRLIVRRLLRRWAVIGVHLSDWPPLPSAAQLASLLSPCRHDSLMHLDTRAANIRCQATGIRALLDWSNALCGDPVLELARLWEYARMPENGIDPNAVLAGYATVHELPDLNTPTALLYRLDAAVMLALVFLSEAPDPKRGPVAAAQARVLYEELASSYLVGQVAFPPTTHDRR